MRFMQSFIELWCDLRGKVSSYQRAMAEALKNTPQPRPPELGENIASLLAPWWGFAAYGIIYAMTVMAIVALFTTTGLEYLFERLGSRQSDPLRFFWLGAILSAPISFLPFRYWIRRRRWHLVEVACNGQRRVGIITKTTTVKFYTGFSFKGISYTSHLTIACGEIGMFRGYVAEQPNWAVPGRELEMIALPNCSYAILLLPNGGLRPLKRKNGSANQQSATMTDRM